MNIRLTGSFYTPSVISDFICKIILSRIEVDSVKVLEPSAGDGSFVFSMEKMNAEQCKKLSITAVDIDGNELSKISVLDKNISLKIVKSDFLSYQSNDNEKYDLIIGNPPYIKRSLLSDFQINLCNELNKEFDLDNKTIKNIWPSFLLSSIKLLSDKGIFAFVLPAEILQVKYAQPIREILTKCFDRVEIITFNELLFKACKGQDTVIVIGERVTKNKNRHGVYFYNVNDVHSLNSVEPSFEKHNVDSNLKWTSHILNSEELDFLQLLVKEIPIMSDVCTSKTGIVSAANNFFIIPEELKLFLDVPDILFKPIIQKSSFLKKDIIVDDIFFSELVSKGMNCYLLDLNGVEINAYPRLMDYIKKGELDKLNLRYKMLNRDIWYNIPHIGFPAPLLFFKRSHLYPRLIKNDALIYATDSAYYVTPKASFSENGIVSSFYNSLTLIMAEIQGRYYGGGVLELTPNEFKSLPIPYLEANASELYLLNKMFSDNLNIEEICSYNDKRLLVKYFPNLSDNDYDRLGLIRKKLVDRRHKL